MPAAPASETPPPAPRPVSGYAHYVLALLFLVTTFNVADRYIFSILLQDIRDAFDLTDTQMGILVGPAFGVFHALASIPVARFADRSVRRSIVAGGLFLWSALTAVTGFAQSFAQLLAARVGVSVTEAAGAAPAHSILADYFPPERRATALAVFGIGGILGMGMGNVAGGFVSDAYGWRAAFFVLGVPGMLLALLVRATVREPQRGAADGMVAAAVAGETTWGVVRYLVRRASYRHMVLAACFHAFAGYGAGTWYPTLLRRVHDMSAGEAGTAFMLAGPLVSAAGAYLGGRLTDRIGLRDARWYMWVPAISALVALPFTTLFVLGPASWRFSFFGIDAPLVLLFMAPASFLGAMWNGPTLAMVLGLARPHMRALAAAVLLSTYNLVGLGLGSLAVGIINDRLEPTYGLEAVRYGLLIVAAAHILGLVHNLIAARTLRADLASVAAADAPARS